MAKLAHSHPNGLLVVCSCCDRLIHEDDRDERATEACEGEPVCSECAPAVKANQFWSNDHDLVLDAMDADYIHPFAHLADCTNLPVSKVRKIARQFREAGLAHYGVCFDEYEPFMRGSGYYLTTAGLNFREVRISALKAA